MQVLSERDRPQSTGELAAALSNAVVRLFAEYTGRGPTRARSIAAPSVITVLLQDSLTKAEKRLVEAGEADAVRALRQTFQRAMRDDLRRVVEGATGRRVLAVLSDHQVENDIAVEVFVLAPSDEPDPGAG